MVFVEARARCFYHHRSAQTPLTHDLITITITSHTLLCLMMILLRMPCIRKKLSRTSIDDKIDRRSRGSCRADYTGCTPPCFMMIAIQQRQLGSYFSVPRAFCTGACVCTDVQEGDYKRDTQIQQHSSLFQRLLSGKVTGAMLLRH